METDIIKTFSAIKNIRHVAYSKMKRFSATHTVAKRHSDAFVYVFTGSCSYHFKDHSFTANGGDMIYLSRDEHYEMLVTSEKYDVIFCDFDFDSEEKRRSVCVTPTSSVICEKNFSELYRYRGEKRDAEAMSRLYRIYSLFSIPEANKDKETSAKAYEIKRLIDENYTRSDLSLSEISEKLNISDVYARRIFLCNFGMQPIKYLNTLRISKAKELLKYSLISLEECALESGFSSPQYFCRVFKKAVGKTPGKYREEKYRQI